VPVILSRKAAKAHSPQRHAELGSASIVPNRPKGRDEKWTLNQVQGDGWGEVTAWFTQSRKGAKEGGKTISFSSSLRLCVFV
jgi:hypothetical protein